MILKAYFTFNFTLYCDGFIIYVKHMIREGNETPQQVVFDVELDKEQRSGYDNYFNIVA